MPSIPDRKNQKLSRFDPMSDEELRAFLQLDASKPEGEASDMEEVLYVMELLSVRRKEKGESRDPYQAFEEFKAHYAPEGSFPEIAPAKPKIHFRWNRVVAIAATLALLLGMIMTVGASKFDFFQIIAKWTKETFYTGKAISGNQMEAEPDITSDFPYAELQSILFEQNVMERIVPTWVPEGFEQQEFTSYELPQCKDYHAYHHRGEEELNFEVKEWFVEVPLQVERSSSLLEVYTLEGIDYYIFENNEELQVVWVSNEFECVISGDISLLEAKQMIDSIKKD